MKSVRQQQNLNPMDSQILRDTDLDANHVLQTLSYRGRFDIENVLTHEPIKTILESSRLDILFGLMPSLLNNIVNLMVRLPVRLQLGIYLLLYKEKQKPFIVTMHMFTYSSNLPGHRRASSVTRLVCSNLDLRTHNERDACLQGICGCVQIPFRWFLHRRVSTCFAQVRIATFPNSLFFCASDHAITL